MGEKAGTAGNAPVVPALVPVPVVVPVPVMVLVTVVVVVGIVCIAKPAFASFASVTFLLP